MSVCTRTGDRGEGAVQLVSTVQLHDVQVQASARAAAVRLCSQVSYAAKAGFPNTAMRVLGSVSLRISSRFPGSSAPSQLKPVMFPWARQAGDESFPYRIIVRRHHDGDRAGGVLRRTDRGDAPYHNHLHLEPDQLGRQVREPLILPSAQRHSITRF